MERDEIIERAITRKGEKNALGVLGRIASVQELKDIMNRAERKHRPVWLRRQLWVFASVAAVIAVVLFVGFQPRYSTEELYASWIVKVVYEPVISRGEDQVQVAFEAALAFATEGKTAEAIEGFERIAADPSSEYVQDAEWYLAMAYLQSGERSRAKEMLTTIVNKRGDYCDKAKGLLDNIRLRRWF